MRYLESIQVQIRQRYLASHYLCLHNVEICVKYTYMRTFNSCFWSNSVKLTITDAHNLSLTQF